MKPKVTRVAGRTRYPHSHSGPDQALPLPNPPPPPSGGGPAGKGCAHSPHNSLSPERPGGLGGGGRQECPPGAGPWVCCWRPVAGRSVEGPACPSPGHGDARPRFGLCLVGFGRITGVLAVCPSGTGSLRRTDGRCFWAVCLHAPPRPPSSAPTTRAWEVLAAITGSPKCQPDPACVPEPQRNATWRGAGQTAGDRQEAAPSTP